MTREQLENGNATRKQIERLQKVLERLKNTAASMDESLVRMTSFEIVHNGDLGRHSLLNINQGELLFLIEAFEKEIAKLESEFRRI